MKLVVFASLGLGLLLCGCVAHQPARRIDDLQAFLPKEGNIAAVLQRAEEHRIQLLISEVVTNRAGQPVLQRYGYRLGAEYFYPASTVKLCAAVAALQEIERLSMANHAPDLLEVPLEISPLFPGDAAQDSDASNLETGKITVGQELRKILLVSDNQAFNRCFDLVGHEQMNRAMHDLGLRSVVINHRLSETRTLPDPLASAEVKFASPAGTIRVPARSSQLLLKNHSRRLQLGRGYLKGEVLVPQPMEFQRRNGVSLLDLQNLLIKVTAPELELGTPPLRLTPVHRAALLRPMTEYPRESKNPVYAAPEYPDEYCKLLLPGVRRIFPSQQVGERIEISGKTGQAYGFTIENCLLRNPQNGRAVFVTAVIYANADGILNDDKYDYATVSKPFFVDLGELVARRWLADATR